LRDLSLREHIQLPGRADVDDQWDDEDNQPKIGLMVPEDLFEAAKAAKVEVSIGSCPFRRDPIYNLSCDGFVLVALGFTGKQALAFMLAHISAFNTMEAKLRQPYVALWLRPRHSHGAKTSSCSTSRPTRRPAC